MEIEEKVKIDYIDNKLSIKKICEKYRIGKNKCCRLISDKNIRSMRDALILAHKIYPESFKHSNEAKEKMRNARLKWMKENPYKTAWRHSIFPFFMV